MFYVYILKSIKSSQYYIGYTQDLKKRVSYHNKGLVLSTKNNRPWQLFYEEAFLSEVEAIRREKQLKSWKSRKAIEKLKFQNKIEDPRFCNSAERRQNRDRSGIKIKYNE